MPTLRREFIVGARLLKPGSKVKYGIPYQGSKTKIIDQIARFFPNADHFYDLFGGGFSVSHYMISHRKNSYKKFHFNEIRPGICELIQDAIAGKYSYNVFKPEWISRDRFMVEKESNAYIKIIWSFGNNGEGYLFGKEIESAKRSMHQAVVFDEFDNFMISTFKMKSWPNKLSITGKRLYLKMAIRNIKRVDLQQLERLERLQQLQQLHFSCFDYKKVMIENSSVIYCDIPYFGTADYGSTFNHNQFFDWASAQSNPVFVSEYEVKDDRFYLIKEFTHRSTFSSSGLKNIPVTERLYGNKIAHKIIQVSRSEARP